MYLKYFGKIQVGIEELSFSFLIQIRPEGSFVVFIFFSPNLVIGNGLHFVPELKKKNIEIFMVTNLQVIYSIWKQFLGKLQLLCSYGCFFFFIFLGKIILIFYCCVGGEQNSFDTSVIY